ncbi:hypothetical protein TNCT_68591 [Trichonephila clavata]|uniref:Uncharacterized protein n=1 Tax=Trichonephila clavata TaxID=2740835 RepID=A0A8X6JLE4_TRICU|nr:hypothetical protein TNCT_68591 [Trichonephila clavata]
MSNTDEQRSGRPVSVRTDLARDIIEQIMYENRRWTLLDRASAIDKRTVHRIPTQNCSVVGTARTDGSSKVIALCNMLRLTKLTKNICIFNYVAVLNKFQICISQDLALPSFKTTQTNCEKKC